MIIQPVILAGGGGTRLWPLSREYYPKQFLKITSDYSLLQNTLGRILTEKSAFEGSASLDVSSPLIICNEEHRFLVLEQADEIGISLDTIILEPVGKNTAPALTCAALNFLSNPETVLLMMPADHVIDDVNSFRQAVRDASLIAEEGNILTFGIIPKNPETGYGYIKKGEDISNNEDESRVFKIKDFVEKPDSEKAKQYVNSGNYLWNSGLFMMQASTWLDAIERYRPDILSACRNAFSQGSRDGVFFRLDSDAFHQCPADSIDYSVIEKLSASDPDKAIVMSLDVGWSDIGSWSSIYDYCEKTGNSNVITGDVITEDASDNLLLSENRLIAVVGCSNLAVVETADVILVRG